MRRRLQLPNDWIMKPLNTFAIYPYLPILLGTLLGAAFGYFGQCSSGTCPLTSTCWRGAIYGAVLGTIFFLTAGRSASTSQTRDSREQDQTHSDH